MQVSRFSLIHYISIFTIMLAALLPKTLSANCDMAAMLAREGHNISWMNNRSGLNYDDPYDFFTFLQDHSSANTNPDGYGIICAGDDGLFPNPVTTASQIEFYFDRVWYVKAPNTSSNAFHYDSYPGPMDDAEATITDVSNTVAVVLGHNRNASSATLGSHPFRFEYDDKVYTFMHNGSIQSAVKSALYNELGGVSWFNQHPPNWTTDYNSPGDLIDSEILFHWIMSKTIDHNGDIFKGVLDALTATVSGIDLQSMFTINWSSNTINFVLSDGEALFLFRNANDSAHKLSWDETRYGLFMAKTQDDLATPLNPLDFVCFPRYGEPTTLSNFLNDYAVDDFVSGEIGNTTWDGTDGSGQTVASGIYFYRLKTEGKTTTSKMLLLK